jgi:hypothetical protein
MHECSVTMLASRINIYAALNEFFTSSPPFLAASLRILASFLFIAAFAIFKCIAIIIINDEIVVFAKTNFIAHLIVMSPLNKLLT